MQNKLISTESITLVIVILIGILIGIYSYQKDETIHANVEENFSVLDKNIINDPLKPNIAEDNESASETAIVKENVNSNQTTVEVTNIPAPKFDLFSIDQLGMATIAGKGLAGQALEIIVDGEVIATVIPDANGEFAIIIDLGIFDQPRSLTLRTRHVDGREIVSAETVLITPILKTKEKKEIIIASKDDSNIDTVQTKESDNNEKIEQVNAEDNGDVKQSKSKDNEETEPKEVKDNGDIKQSKSKDNEEIESKEVKDNEESQTSNVSVAIVSSKELKIVSPAVQKNAPRVSDVIIDAISYDDQGEVLLAGRGVEEQHIRIYVDNKPIKTRSIEADGTWSLDLQEIDAGVYILRIDQLDSDGVVTSRTETPFQKETTEVAKQMTMLENSVAADNSPKVGIGLSTVIIQPGYTLWAVARRTYGFGMQYVRIYHANRDQIRDPDLIYPGQIFKLPG